MLFFEMPFETNIIVILLITDVALVLPDILQQMNSSVVLHHPTLRLELTPTLGTWELQPTVNFINVPNQGPLDCEFLVALGTWELHSTLSVNDINMDTELILAKVYLVTLGTWELQSTVNIPHMTTQRMLVWKFLVTLGTLQL